MSRRNLFPKFAGRGLARALARVDPRNSMTRAEPKARRGASNHSVMAPNRRYAPLRAEGLTRFRFGSRFALHRASSSQPLGFHRRIEQNTNFLVRRIEPHVRDALLS